MKITINTFGTRGDIQPYIALSLGLQQAGHSVRILTHQIFEPFVKEYDLDFYPLDLDPREVLINQALSDLGNNTIRITRWMKENFKPVLREIFEVTLAANQDTELMLNSGLSFAGWHVAEKLSIPSLATFLWPMTPSRHFLGAIGKIPPTWLPFRGVINYYTTKLFNQLFYNLMLSPVNECRKEVLSLRPMKAREYWSLDSPQSATSIIYGYSSIVVPKPLNHQIGVIISKSPVTGFLTNRKAMNQKQLCSNFWRKVRLPYTSVLAAWSITNKKKLPRSLSMPCKKVINTESYQEDGAHSVQDTCQIPFCASTLFPMIGYSHVWGR